MTETQLKNRTDLDQTFWPLEEGPKSEDFYFRLPIWFKKVTKAKWIKIEDFDIHA